MEEENIFLAEEKKNGEGKGGNIWRRKIYFFRRRRKTEKEKEEIFGEGKYIFCLWRRRRGEEKNWKREICFLRRTRKTKKEEENLWRRKIAYWMRKRRSGKIEWYPMIPTKKETSEQRYIQQDC